MAAVVNEKFEDGCFALLRRIDRDNELDAADANISERTGDAGGFKRQPRRKGRLL